MAQLAEIVIERQSANDSGATVVEIHLAGGSPVKKGQRLFAVETSKAVEEVQAPADGFLVHALKLGEIVPFGVAIARICDEPEAPPVLVAAAAPEPSPAANGAAPLAMPSASRRAPRLSRAAATLAAQLGISPAAFASDFVTTADVRRLIGGTLQPAAAPMVPVSAPPVAVAPTPASPIPGNLEPVPTRKREEILALSRGAGSSMLSVVGAELGAAGLDRSDTGMFATRIVDLVVYHAARLMCRYRKLNAAWHEGGVEYHDAVNAGVAYDNGGRLVVYGIANADRLDLAEIQDEIIAGLRKYTRNRFTAAELTRATFTVTDLSPAHADFLFPLLPIGQSAIIGISGGPERGFSLNLGFDHRVTEGLEASRFLHELARAVVDSAIEGGMIHRKCAFCGGEPAADAPLPAAGLLRLTDRTGAEVLCCRDCWSASA